MGGGVGSERYIFTVAKGGGGMEEEPSRDQLSQTHPAIDCPKFLVRGGIYYKVILSY